MVYALQLVGSCRYPITRIADCSAAAKSLKLPDTTASGDGQQLAVSFDPPYCRIERGHLHFNAGGNTGSCSPSDVCICRTSPEAPSGSPSPGPGVAPSSSPSLWADQEYHILASGSCTSPVLRKQECSAAALALGLDDMSASPDGQDGVSFDPPFCYFESASLKFNSGGSNRGSCTASDLCICTGASERPGAYELRPSGHCVHPITRIRDCSAAATALGLSDANASADGQSGAPHDPPYCYVENGLLKFNSGGSNTGRCTSKDLCLCATSAQAAPPGAPSSPSPSPVWSPSPSPSPSPWPSPSPSSWPSSSPSSIQSLSPFPSAGTSPWPSAGSQRCVDSPGDWQDSEDMGCATYAAEQWCTGEGGYDIGWARRWGTFERHAAVDGMSATKACCACGGGARSAFAGVPPEGDSRPDDDVAVAIPVALESDTGTTVSNTETDTGTTVSNTATTASRTDTTGTTTTLTSTTKSSTTATSATTSSTTVTTATTLTSATTLSTVTTLMMSAEGPLGSCFPSEFAAPSIGACDAVSKSTGSSYYEMSVGSASPSEWTLVFEAEITSMRKNDYLIGFGTKKMMRGKTLNKDTECGPNTGSHTWMLVNAEGEGVLYCDGREIARTDLSGGYVLPANCAFLVGATTNGKCKARNGGAMLQVTDMVLWKGDYLTSQGTTTTETMTTTTLATPAPTSLVGASCFVPGAADTAAVCHDSTNNQGRGYYKLSTGTSSSSQWTLQFEADVKSLSNQGYLVGFGEHKMMTGKQLKRISACKAGTGWHTWILAIDSGLCLLSCDGQQVQEMSLPGGYSVPSTCSFLVGSSFTDGHCSGTASRAKLYVRGMVLFEVSPTPSPTPEPATQCFVPGSVDTAAGCHQQVSAGGVGYYELSLGVNSSDRWVFTFDADVASIHRRGYLVGFGGAKMMKGKAMSKLSSCAPGSGWHTWSVEVEGATSTATLYCDGHEVQEIICPGGCVVSPSCSFIVGSYFTDDQCSTRGKSATLSARSLVLAEVGEYRRR